VTVVDAVPICPVTSTAETTTLKVGATPKKVCVRVAPVITPPPSSSAGEPSLYEIELETMAGLLVEPTLIVKVTVRVPADPGV
jgi:hypothetical protein